MEAFAELITMNTCTLLKEATLFMCSVSNTTADALPEIKNIFKMHSLHGCHENSDPENSDPENPDPEKTQTPKTQTP